MTPTEEGARKAAILLLSLGEDVGRDLFPLFDDGEIQAVARHVRSLTALSIDDVTSVLAEFNTQYDNANLLPPDGEHVFRNMAEQALGEERTRAIIDRTAMSLSPAFLTLCERVDPSLISSVLSREHPQAVALVVAAMPSQLAASVLGQLPEGTAGDVVQRISTLGNVSLDVLRRIEEALMREIDAVLQGGVLRIDGSAITVAMLREAGADVEEKILENLSAQAPETAHEIRRRLFVFEDLAGMDRRGMQTLLREIDGSTLRVAMKTATPGLREHILANLSERAAAMLLEDMEALGPVPVRDVEKAQEEIVGQALELARSGRIRIGRGGKDALV